MADEVEDVGVNLVAENAERFTANIKNADKAAENFGKTITDVIRAIGSGDLGNIAQSFGRLTAASGEVQSSFEGMKAAGAAVGVEVSSGASIAVGALGAIAAAAAAAAAAVVGIGAAINSAVNFGAQLNQIQSISGASAEMAGQFYQASRVSGVSFGSISSTLVSLDKQLDRVGATGSRAMNTVAKATDTLNTRLQRLNEDHAARLADIDEARVERLAAINAQIVAAQESLNERLSRSNEDYNRNIEDSRRQLNERLATLNENHAEKIQSISEKIAELETNTAQGRQDAERDLLRKIADLNNRASEQIASAQASGAKEQEKIQESLQSELYRIEQKYSDKRQSLQDKIADPATNPILRAYYKTQIKSINDVQKAEEASAKARAGGESGKAGATTNAAINAIKAQLQQQTALENQKAAESLARDQANYQTKFTALQASLAKENAEYAKQGDAIRADSARREEDLRRSHDRQLLDANAAYAKQVAASATAQAAILAETDKRIAKESLSYARGLEDIQTAQENLAKTAAAAGGGGGLAPQLERTAEAFKTLGINADAFNAADEAGKIKLLSDAYANFAANGKIKEFQAALTNAVGPVRAAELTDFLRTLQGAKDAGFTQEQIDNAKSFKESLNLLGFQVELLVAQFGSQFLPAIQRIITKFQEFWSKHGPEVTAALKALGSFIADVLINVVTDLWRTFNNQILPAFRAVQQFVVNDLVPALTRIKTGFDAVYKAADDATKLISVTVGPALRELARLLGFDGVGGAVKRVEDGFNSLKSALEGIVNYVTGSLTRAWRDFQNTLNNIHLPQFLTPGSPTPFEMGLRGIADAMRDVNRVGLPALQGTYSMSATGGQTMAATPAQMAARSTTNNNQRSASSVIINQQISGGATGAVRDETYSALVRAGLVVVH